MARQTIIFWAQFNETPFFFFKGGVGWLEIGKKKTNQGKNLCSNRRYVCNLPTMVWMRSFYLVRCSCRDFCDKFRPIPPFLFSNDHREILPLGEAEKPSTHDCFKIVSRVLVFILLFLRLFSVGGCSILKKPNPFSNSKIRVTTYDSVNSRHLCCEVFLATCILVK